MAERYYTTSTAFLEALAEAGIKHAFATLGSDHPGLIEALAHARAEGRADELPRLIACPHETVALSAAHAYAALTHNPQAVTVHALRGRVPVLVFAGSAPYTMRGYVKYDNEIRSGKNVKQIVHIPVAQGGGGPAVAAVGNTG